MLRRIATLPVPAGQAARRAQEIFGDEIGREKCLRNRLDQRHFWWLRGRETLNRPIRRGWRHRGPKLGQLGQNLAEGRPVGLYKEKSERQNGSSGPKGANK